MLLPDPSENVAQATRLHGRPDLSSYLCLWLVIPLFEKLMAALLHSKIMCRLITKCFRSTWRGSGFVFRVHQNMTRNDGVRHKRFFKSIYSSNASGEMSDASPSPPAASIINRRKTCKRALRARASVLNLFKGVTRSNYARKGELGGPLTKRVAGSDREPRGSRKGGSDCERRQQLQLPLQLQLLQRSGGEVRGRRDYPSRQRQTGGSACSAAATATWNAATSSHNIPSGLDCPSPGEAATAVNSPVAQSGTGDQPTSSLLERPEAPPAGRYLPYAVKCGNTEQSFIF